MQQAIHLGNRLIMMHHGNVLLDIKGVEKKMLTIEKLLDAFEKVIRAMKEANIGYGSINHPVDRDPVCGFTGIIGDVCPSCGRHEGDIKFERIRRITGYLVGTLDNFNDAKRAEERDRVKHFSCNSK